MTQAAFAFAAPTADYAGEDFLVSEANREAMAWVDRWPDWSARGLIIGGPASSGKTHLAHLWAQKTGASFLAPCDLEGAPPESLAGGSPPVAVLDGMEGLTRPAQEEGLFHLLNYMAAHQGAVLITSRCPVRELPIRLPDLRSRLAALPFIPLQLPDDALLEALLRKQLSDRQLRVGEEVIAWLLSRMERSFSQAAIIAQLVDEASLEQRRPITVPFVRELLAADGFMVDTQHLATKES